ncbi:hypothetical protein DKX38_022956 [Salix brachista]|uniref:UVR domain-containing protein n=1 Tax=Salix brachista TaxID=2182728 RepID=A0A5N5KC06_9ROSI|nr:hypothetical protein DKX38_022956 [Salix brachista]
MKGQKLAESIGANRSTYIHCDVTDENQVKSLVESTVQLYGQLDVIFCNAGIMNSGQQTVLDLDLDSYDKLFAINVRGVTACLKHTARAMLEGGVKGSIICMSSTAANLVGSTMTDYIMAKWPVATPMVCELTNMGVEEVEKLYESSYCLKGVLKAKHVADAVLFLASEDSEIVTGQNAVVDGGYTFQAFAVRCRGEEMEAGAVGAAAEGDGGSEQRVMEARSPWERDGGESDRFLPDKAIDLIDEAGSRVRLRHAQVPEEARELEKEVRQITKEKDEAVRGQDFEKAGELRDREMDLRAQIAAIVEKGKEMSKAETEAGDAGPPVTESDIQHIVSSWVSSRNEVTNHERFVQIIQLFMWADAIQSLDTANFVAELRFRGFISGHKCYGFDILAPK